MRTSKSLFFLFLTPLLFDAFVWQSACGAGLPGQSIPGQAAPGQPAPTFQNPAAPTQLPNTPNQSLPPVILPFGSQAQNQPLSGDMQQYDRNLLKANPIKLGALIEVASLKPLQLDARFNQPITLEKALRYVLDKSLPIKISHESDVYQATQLGYYLSYYLPSVSTGYSIADSYISSTTANANVFNTRVIFPLFVGGNYVNWGFAQNYRRRGWHQAYIATVNDALLDAYTKYTNLVLNHHLLRIRLKALELSAAQLEQQRDFYKAGTGTRYAILQAEAQVATDRQALMKQQVTTRQSALLLGYALDMPLAVNLVPTDLEMVEAPLIRGKPKIAELLNIAFACRPELREYEDFRLGAARDVQIGYSPLYPTASIFIAYTRALLSFNGNPHNLIGTAVTQISGSGTGGGTTSNTSLGQTASLSPGNDLTATGGANTTAASIVAASGGTPIANTQSGSLVTSGAVAPGIISPISVSGSSSSNINGSNTQSFGTAPGLFSTIQAGINISWSLGNMGLASAANIVALRALSRQALLQANQQIQLVTDQVRTDYLNSLSTLAQIEVTGSQLDTNEEALRLAQLRIGAGQGTTLELEQAKNNYVNSLATEAQSIIASKQSEAQLLHDLGVISIDTLTKGFATKDAHPGGRTH